MSTAGVGQSANNPYIDGGGSGRAPAVEEQLNQAEIRALIQALTGDTFSASGPTEPGRPTEISSPSAALAQIRAETNSTYGPGNSGASEENLLTMLKNKFSQKNQGAGIQQLIKSQNNEQIQKQMQDITEAIQLASKLSSQAYQTNMAVINNV